MSELKDNEYAWRCGFRAGDDREPRNSNPYPMGSDHAILWDGGWEYGNYLLPTQHHIAAAFRALEADLTKGNQAADEILRKASMLDALTEQVRAEVSAELREDTANLLKSLSANTALPIKARHRLKFIAKQLHKHGRGETGTMFDVTQPGDGSFY